MLRSEYDREVSGNAKIAVAREASFFIIIYEHILLIFIHVFCTRTKYYFFPRERRARVAQKPFFALFPKTYYPFSTEEMIKLMGGKGGSTRALDARVAR